MLAKVIPKTGAGGKGFGDLVRYIARDNPEQAGALRPDLGTLNLDCPLDTPEDRHTVIGILDGTAQALSSRRATAHPAYHVTLAWQAGEHPRRQQIEAACAQVLQALGFAGHEALWALHRDTAHDHVHLVINRVHPDTGRMQEVPRRDWLILDQAMREIELAQGWQHSPGPYAVVPGQGKVGLVRRSRAERAALGQFDDGPRVSNAAKAAEHRNAGAQSFQAWLVGEPAQALRAALQLQGANWQSLHQAAARYGVRIAPKGSGMVVTTTLDDERVLAAKASQLGRWASKAALEQRLGPYEPPRGTMPEATTTYAGALDDQRASLRGEPQDATADPQRLRRRAERAQARTLLAARFKAEQEASRAQRPALREALTERHRAERRVVTAELRQMRAAALAEHQRDGMRPQVAIAYQAWIAAARREEVQKRQAAERKALIAKVPRAEVWRTWLEQQAERGDEAAQAALRGIRYRAQRKVSSLQDGIEGEELDPLRKLTVAALQAEIDHKRQLVIYRGRDGGEKFTDTGPRIVMHDKADDSLEAALRIAAQKYGGKVAITGSSAFRERAARQAVRLGITVTNDDLQVLVADAQGKLQAQRRHQADKVHEPLRRDNTPAVSEPPTLPDAPQQELQPVPEQGTVPVRQMPPPPRVQRPDPSTDVLARWWNPKGQAERAAWSDLSEQRGGNRGAWGAWHAMRDYVDAEADVPASIAQAKASDRQRGRGR